MSERNIRIREGDSPERLLELTHQQFYNLVDQDVRNRLDSAVSQMLREPSVVERWFLVLVQMKKNVESQLASAKADWQTTLFEILAAMEDAATDSELSDLRAEQYTKASAYAGARAKKLRFRSAVEDNLAEARYLRNMQLEKRASRRLAHSDARKHELSEAIAHHQSQVGEQATSDDLALWAVLYEDGRTELTRS